MLAKARAHCRLEQPGLHFKDAVEARREGRRGDPVAPCRKPDQRVAIRFRAPARPEVDAEGGPQMLPEPAPAPGMHPIDTGEWDFYTPEEIDDLSGPESDHASAWNLIRLGTVAGDQPICVAITAH
jgi:hypothetical protein